MALILHPHKLKFSISMLLLTRRFIHYTNATCILADIAKKPNKSYASSLSRECRLKEAVGVLAMMDERGIRVDSQTYASLLNVCTEMKALNEGKQVHTHMINSGINLPFPLGVQLISMYTKCGSMEEARQVFDKMPKRTLFLWGSMIGGYVRQGRNGEALRLYAIMEEKGVGPDRSLFVWVLNACSQHGRGGLEKGKKVHDHIARVGFESDVLVGNALIDMYGKCGDLENARLVFDKMSQPDVVSWTSMIAACIQKGRTGEAFGLFRRIQAEGLKADSVTVTSILPVCANLGNLKRGKEIHGYIIRGGFEGNVFVSSSVLDMYAKCGHLKNARQVFDNMPHRDVVSWNAMVATYAQKGWHKEAHVLFHQMQHDGIEPDVISWNAMIAGCAQNGQGDDALKLFCQMQQGGMKPSSISISSVLPACAHLAALQKGKEIHGYVVRSGNRDDVIVASALVAMYGKSGSLKDACRVFEKASERDTIAWNTMIGAYAMYGHGEKALQLFYEMELAGLKANSVTFAGVLNACSHAGMVDEGLYFFDSMEQEHHVIPDADHYASMVDLLGRAGRLNEAHDLIKRMPMEPNARAWGALLAACRIHKNIEFGKIAADCLFALEPDNPANCVLLSNIYAASGKWDEVSSVRTIMNEKGLSKTPGRSWIEVKNRVHTFSVGDRSHPESDRIYELLDDLTGKMKEAGYLPNTDFVLRDLEGGEKESFLRGHSEKLAIAFGLLNICPGKPIRIIKNLRVCGDCHTAIKFISKIVEREIIVRDFSRFHNFKHGLCSCGDYW